MKKLLKFLLATTTGVLLIACGGGGGGGGTPNGPSATLRVYPPVDTISLPIGASGSTGIEVRGGKAPYGVARMAKNQLCRVIGMAGKVPDFPDAGLDHYFDWIFSINEKPTPLEEAIKNTRTNLVKAGEKIGRRILCEDL